MDTGFGLGGCINKGGLEFFLWGSGVPWTPDGRYTSYWFTNITCFGTFLLKSGKS